MKHTKDWYKDLVIYQIYPRSFKDGNNANANLNNLYYKNVRDDKEHKPVPFEFYE